MRAATVVLVLLVLFPAASSLALSAGSPGPTDSARALVSLHGPVEDLASQALAERGVRVLETFPASHVLLAQAPASALAALRALPFVAGVYPEEPEHFLLASSRAAVRVTQDLWDAGVDGSGVVVAVVDSGIDEQHPDLQGRVVRSLRVDDGGVHAGGGDKDGHGTHIAGIVAGDGAASQGREAGLAPRASLVAVDISSSFTTTNAVRAFEWLHDHAGELSLRIVSNSWGREKDDARYDADDPVIRAADALVDEGITVVFSAGNRGPGPGTLTVEAQDPKVITVGASDDQGLVASYSSRGPAKLADGTVASWVKPDLLAPGTGILSARANGRGSDAYVTLNGTSMATPHVAGIAALLLTADPTLKPAQVAKLLTSTARDRGIGGVDTDNGAGFVDAAAALAPLLATATLEPLRVPFSASGSVTPAASVVPGTLVPASLGASSPVSSDVRQAIPVGAHAVGLDVTFRWDDARASFQLFLERGAQRLGPLGVASRDGQGSVLAAHVEQALEQGDWDLVARSSGPSVATHYTVEGDVLVRAVAPTHARAAVEPFAGAASFLRSGPLGDSAAVTPWLVAAPLALLAALAWRRARSVEGMPWSLPLVEGRTGRSTLRGMSPAPGQRLPSRR